MSISKCIVRLKDCHDTEHSVEVYAGPLYEAVLRGLNRLQDIGWESEHGRNDKARRGRDSPRAYETYCRCSEAAEAHESGARNQESKAAEVRKHIGRCKVQVDEAEGAFELNCWGQSRFGICLIGQVQNILLLLSTKRRVR